MRLIAVKPLKYGTRRLMAGDAFDALDRHGRVLVAVRKARYAPLAPAEPAATPEPLAPPVADSGADELKAARDAYEAAVGRKPYWGWDADTLRVKIAEAQAADDA